MDEFLLKHRLQPTHASLGSLALLKKAQLMATRGLGASMNEAARKTSAIVIIGYIRGPDYGSWSPDSLFYHLVRRPSVYIGEQDIRM